jgi:hypothetical protein
MEAEKIKKEVNQYLISIEKAESILRKAHSNLENKLDEMASNIFLNFAKNCIVKTGSIDNKHGTLVSVYISPADFSIWFRVRIDLEELYVLEENINFLAE